MKVVVDANVLISAAFRDRLPEDVIMFLVSHPEFQWIAAQDIVRAGEDPNGPGPVNRKERSLKWTSETLHGIMPIHWKTTHGGPEGWPSISLS